MGNISFLIPTTNLNEYNCDSIVVLLRKNFPDLITKNDSKMESSYECIEVSYKNKEVVYFCFDKLPSYLLDEINECEKELINHKCVDSKILKNILSFKAIPLNKELKVLSYKHDNSITEQHRRKIEIFLHSYFKCFILDEGINPEMITPDYVFKSQLKEVIDYVKTVLINKKQDFTRENIVPFIKIYEAARLSSELSTKDINFIINHLTR